jgi:hypothetical protein
MTTKTRKKASKKRTTRKKTTRKKASVKQVPKKVELKPEDIRPVPHVVLTGEVDELSGLPKAQFKGKYTNEEQEVLAKTAPSRSLKDLAKKAQTKREDDETTAWLEEQAEELSGSAKGKFKLDPRDILAEFDKTLTRGMFDKDSLDAMMTHGTIENLEKMYGEAQADLLKAKRKAMVLEMIVSKAHNLLSEQALTFLAK